MGKFSTYRYLELKDSSLPSPSQSRSRPAKSTTSLKKIFLFVLLLGLFGVYAVGFFPGYFGSQSQWIDKIADSLGYQSTHYYALVIDAGSSGSRVLAYKFRVPFTDPYSLVTRGSSIFGTANPDLVEEFFAQSKPGLSSYVDRPKEGADSIVQLIKKANFLVPVENRPNSPLIVRATAGLRLLPEEKANLLIKEVDDAVSKLGYDTSAGVEIMDGADEGIYIWYTVNLLLNSLEGSSMAALDLGGGSTQITCELDINDALVYPKKDQYILSHGKNITLYTHSYLNLGLLAARHGIFHLEADIEDGVIKSSCVEPIIQKESWTYANKEYIISGRARPANIKKKAAFKLCYDVVKRYVAATAGTTYKPRGSIAAMSYFYDVAVDAGIVGINEKARILVEEYQDAATRACSASNVEQPWACVDLVYVLTLLHDAYKLDLKHPITLLKQVDGHEVSWALGIAYTTVLKNAEERSQKEAKRS